MAEKLVKGTRVSFIGDPAAGTKAKGTVMQFLERTGQYEIHTDLGSVIYLPSVDANGNTVLEVLDK